MKICEIALVDASNNKLLEIHKAYESAPENQLLYPFNQSSMIGQEKLIADYGDIKGFQAMYVTATMRSVRYVKYDNNGDIIAALQFATKGPRSKKATIQNVYTRKDHRREGLASQLLRKARYDFDIKHSTDLTDDGKAWKSGIGESNI